MSKIIAISGNHYRHFHVFSEVNKVFPLAGHIIVQRENIIPVPPANTSPRDAKNFELHFKKRDIAEKKYFGEVLAPNCPSIKVIPEALNTQASIDFVNKIKPDIVLIFGSGLVKDPLYSVLPKHTVNMHLGLSPRYRGAATLFWPFYYMDPLSAGATFHRIVSEPDAGDVIHQTVPDLLIDDGIHDVGCKTVLAATQDLIRLLQILKNDGAWQTFPQTSTGKNFLISDFKPHHLRVIYELFNDDMVKHVLSGDLPSQKPKLIRQF